MEGTFGGWRKGNTFGFVKPDDGSSDVFVHRSAAPAGIDLREGDRLQFDVVESPRGRSATGVVFLSRPEQEDRPRVRGRVQTWSPRGFGFILAADGGPSVFVHQSALPRELRGYLSEGDVVEYIEKTGEKGRVASDITVVGWDKGSGGLSSFADMGPVSWADDLKALAESEPWEYRHAQSAEPMPILRSYLRYTFQRLEETGGIRTSANGRWTAFNTGLVTTHQEEIYAMFKANPRVGRQPWTLSGFKKASDWDFVENFGASPPPLANYFEDPSVLLYDRRCDLYINIDHVLEHIERFPSHLAANPYVARQLLSSAEATTKKRVYRNYKAAIPQYYRDKGGEGSVQLLLPICLENPAKADLALVVAKNDAGTAYRGSTVLTLDMAYNNARLLTRPDTEWLQP